MDEKILRNEITQSGKGVDEPVKKGQVEQQLENLNELGHRLTDIVAILEEKLGPILAENTPADKEEKELNPVIVELAAIIRNENFSIENSIKKLYNIKSRIEL